MLALRFKRLSRKTSPLDAVPGEAKRANWVTPELVAEVRYAELTADGMTRQGAYLCLREDKPADEVTAHDLDAAAPEEPEEREVAGVRISSANCPVYPQAGLTKGGLADYYAAAADRLLVHGHDRPLSLIRCPGGISRSCFFQKHGGKGFPRP